MIPRHEAVDSLSFDDPVLAAEAAALQRRGRQPQLAAVVVGEIGVAMPSPTRSAAKMQSARTVHALVEDAPLLALRKHWRKPIARRRPSLRAVNVGLRTTSAGAC